MLVERAIGLKFNASGFHNPSQRSEQVHAIRRNQFGQNCLPMPASIIPKNEVTIERHRQNLAPLFRARRTVAHTSDAVVRSRELGREPDMKVDGKTPLICQFIGVCLYRDWSMRRRRVVQRSRMILQIKG